jgi:hypothetical protein
LGLKLGQIGSLGQAGILPKTGFDPQNALLPKTVLPYSLEFIRFDRLNPAAIPQLGPAAAVFIFPSAGFAEIAGQGSAAGLAYLDTIISVQYSPGLCRWNYSKLSGFSTT